MEPDLIQPESGRDLFSVGSEDVVPSPALEKQRGE